MRAGHGVPGAGLGLNNDWYTDLDSGLQYQKIGGAWGQIFQPTIDHSKITGQITNAQIASLDAAKLTGTLPHGALPAIDVNTDTVGTLPYARLTGTPTIPKITTSLMSGGPPAAPSDGDIWIATAVDTGNVATTNGTRWHFQYNAGSASAYKWECIGGSLYHIEGSPGAIYSALTQIAATGWYYWPGAAITLPRAGDYFIQVGSQAGQSAGGNAQASIAVADVTNASVPLGSSRRDTEVNATVLFANMETEELVLGRNAGVVVAPTWSANVAFGVNNVSIDVIPRRIS